MKTNTTAGTTLVIGVLCFCQTTAALGQNLLDWVTLTTDPNTAGMVNFIDTSAGAFGHRFCRVVGN